MTFVREIYPRREIRPSRSRGSRACLPALFLLALTASAVAHPQAAPVAGAKSAPRLPQPDIVYATAAEAEALIAKAKAERKEGQTVGPLQPLVRIPGYRALVEYRVGPTPAAVHDKDAEFIYVLDGSGTLITGGTLADAKHVNAVNQRGSGITGGTPRTLAKGDSVFLPPGMPHHFAVIGGEGLAVIALHIPPQPPSP